MPITAADKQQVDTYMKTKQPHLARRLLEDHLRNDPFDEVAKKALAKVIQNTPSDFKPSSPPPPKDTAFPSAPFSTAPAAAKPKLKAVPDPFANVDAVPPSDDIAPIKQAILEKRYEDAEAMLILSDHPDAEKLRERLAAIRGGGGKTKTVYAGPEKDFTNKFAIACILIFFAFIPGLIAFEIFAAEAKQYPDAPGAQKLISTRRNILILMAIIFTLSCSLWAWSARMAHLAHEARYR
jgi:hypothetical protein